MEMNTFNELKKASKSGKVFLVMENGKHIIIKDLAVLPFKDKTLGLYLEALENSYNDKISVLEGKLEKQQEIIKELVSAIDTLNKKGV